MRTTHELARVRTGGVENTAGFDVSLRGKPLDLLVALAVSLALELANPFRAAACSCFGTVEEIDDLGANRGGVD